MSKFRDGIKEIDVVTNLDDKNLTIDEIKPERRHKTYKLVS